MLELFAGREEVADVRLTRAIGALAAHTQEGMLPAPEKIEQDPFGIWTITHKRGASGGIDPDYLWKLAKRESALNPLARANTSSAAGLYQFTANTWLCALREFGPDLNISHADEIQRTISGICVAPAANQAALLALRFDPTISTEIAAAYSLENYHLVHSAFGRKPRMSDLYVLHFFGERVGLAFLNIKYLQPDLVAYRFAPDAARANRVIFFDGERPRSLFEVGQLLGNF